MFEKYRANKKAKKHRLVGTVIWNPELESYVVITKYYSNDSWYFKRCINDLGEEQYGKESEAVRKFDFYIENEFVVGEDYE